MDGCVQVYVLLALINSHTVHLIVCMYVCIHKKKDECTRSSIRHVLHSFRPFSVEHDDFISLGMSKK